MNACGGGALWRGERTTGAYSLKQVIGAGCRQVARIAARTFSMRLRRVIWLGRPGCTRSPRRGPCGYEGELSVKRVSERV